jgi:REP element-mobilizing transposase RayT
MDIPSPNQSNSIARAKRSLDEKYGQSPPEPFLGWHARGYLPHCDKPGLIQLVTFRLQDAMPAERRHEWELLIAIADERERRTKLEAYLDRGYGACWLKHENAARLAESTLLFHDAQRYRLCAWVVMPNHVHVLFEVWQVPMSEIVYSWKRFGATKMNKALGLEGRFWQKEYWDRFMRDEEHFNRARHYVESNPVKAGLCARAEDWPWSSANSMWKWEIASAQSRYRGGHLASPNWQQFMARARPE